MRSTSTVVVLHFANNKQIYFSSSLTMKSGTWTFLHFKHALAPYSIGIMEKMLAEKYCMLLSYETDYFALFSDMSSMFKKREMEMEMEMEMEFLILNSSEDEK